MAVSFIELYVLYYEFQVSSSASVHMSAFLHWYSRHCAEVTVPLDFLLLIGRAGHIALIN
jgi:hypothetical protein